MSTIEIKIVAPELAEALNNLAAAIAGRGGDTSVFVVGENSNIAPSETEIALEKPKTTRAKRTETPSETVSEDAPATAPSASTDEASSSTSQSEAPSDVSYPEVQARVIGLAKHSRDAATGLLGEFGVSHGKELKEEQWAEFISAADAKIAEFANA